MYFFFSGSAYPYVLAAPAEVNPLGKTIKIKGFGQYSIAQKGVWKPDELALPIIENLKKLEESYYAELQILNSAYHKKLKEVFPEIVLIRKGCDGD